MLDRRLDRNLGISSLILLVVGALVLAVGIAALARAADARAAQQQRQQPPRAPWAQLQPAQGYMPEVLLIRAFAPDTARVCVEWEGQVVDCRYIGDLKKWARQRAAK